jgi:hypothetical protein
VGRLAVESEGNAVSAKQPQAEQVSALDARIFSDLELLPPKQTLRHMSNHSSKEKLPNYIHIFSRAVLINCI